MALPAILPPALLTNLSPTEPTSYLPTNPDIELFIALISPKILPVFKLRLFSFLKPLLGIND